MAINPIKLLRRSAGVIWENAGQLALSNLLFLLMSLTVVGLPAALLGLSYSAARLKSGRKTSSRELVRFSVRIFFKGLALGLVYFVIIFLIAINLRFYGGFEGLWWGLRLMLRTVILLIGLFFMLSAVYSPMLVATSGLGPLAALRAGGLLVLDNPALSLLFFFLTIIWWLVSGATVLLFILFGFTVPATVTAFVTDELVRSYNGTDDDE
jgi:hypothetical protein